MSNNLDKQIAERLNNGGFDAIDWGSSKGGSLEYIEKKFGLSDVVGIDIDPVKVAEARNAGRAILTADATAIDINPDVVSASFMFHFLEHLPSKAHARLVLRNACRASRDMAIIRQPFFGSDEELLRMGLKFAWSTWKGHSNLMSTLDFYEILRDLQSEGLIQSFRIGYGIPILDTGDSQILPLTAASEAPYYEQERDGPKPFLQLEGLYREVCVAVQIADRLDWKMIDRAIRVHRWIV